MVKVIDGSELSNGNSTYMIYANPGMGKTYTLGFLPGKTLILDIDQSSSTLMNHPNKKNLTIWQLDSSNMWDEWLDVVTMLVKDKEKYEKEFDNIAVDNLTELFKAQLENLGKQGKNAGVPSQANYQQSDFMNLRSLRGLKSIDVNLVLTAWETTDDYTDENGQVMTRSMPDIRAKIINNYLGLCDVVGRLVTSRDSDGNFKRGLILQPTISTYAKNRLDERSGSLAQDLFNFNTGGEANVPAPQVSESASEPSEDGVK